MLNTTHELFRQEIQCRTCPENTEKMPRRTTVIAIRTGLESAVNFLPSAEERASAETIADSAWTTLPWCLPGSLQSLVHVLHGWSGHLQARVACALFAADGLEGLGMLSGDSDGVNLQKLDRAVSLLLVLNGDMGLAIGPQPPERAILADIGQGLAKLGGHRECAYQSSYNRYNIHYMCICVHVHVHTHPHMYVCLHSFPADTWLSVP